MKISTLLKMIGVVFVVLTLLMIAGMELLRANYVNVRNAIDRQAEFKQLGFDLANASDYLTNEARRYVQFGEKKHYDNYWKEVNETKTRDRVLARLKELHAPENELALLDKAKNNSDALVKTEEAAMKAVERGDFDAARKLMFDANYDANKKIISEPINEFQNMMNTRAQKETHSVENRFYTYLYLVIGIVVIVSISMITSVIMLFRKLKPLGLVVDKLRELAGNKGDLTARLPKFGRDEIGSLAESFNSMLDNYRTFVAHIAGNAQHVAAASQQITAAAHEIAVGSQSQSQSAQTINELFRELTIGMETVSKNTEGAADITQQASRIAQQGGAVINSSIEGMKRLARQVDVLVNDSDKVGQIIEVIDEIADQTNLLALNAAIEAARAGDQGRGFAVVADEVRKLAERSQEATKEISGIIKVMQDNMKASAKATEETVQYSRESGEAFESIIRMVENASVQVSEIAAASEEQTAQTAEILSSVEAIAAGSEQAAASSQETAASTQMLAKLAEELSQSVSAFKV